MSETIKYITSRSLSDNVLASIEDSLNWGVNNAVINTVKIITSSIDWDLTFYCDSDQSSGMFNSIKVANNLSGDQTLFLDIPYIDNDNNSKVHCLFVDNDGSNGATIEIFGKKGRIE